MLNKIFNEDCLEGMKRIPDGSIDAIITDPPYGTTACKWDSVIPFDLMWEQLNRIIKPNGAIVLFGSEPFSSALRMSNIKNYKYDWVWQKSKSSNITQVKYAPLKNYENVLIFGKNKVNYNPQMNEGKPYYKGIAKKTDIEFAGMKRINNVNFGTRYPKTIQYFRTAESEGKKHPTQKPVALIEYLIRTYTQEGETVLDFTMGSGTLAIAAINTNRNYIGFEMDKGYFDIAQERITTHYGKIQS